MAARTLLIGLDAADWRLMQPLITAGHLPCFRRLIEGGASGDLLTQRPCLSPILWTTIATGKRARQHGILGFTEAAPNGEVQMISSRSRRCKALWNMLGEHQRRCHVVNWFASHPAERINGCVVSNVFPFVQSDGSRSARPPVNAVQPPGLIEAIGTLRLLPDEIPEDALGLFFPPDADLTHPQCARARSFLAEELSRAFTVHAAATHVLEHEPWDFAAVYFGTLDAIAHTFIHFHPPKLPWVDESLFRLCRDVVNSAYRMFDLLLTRLLVLAGPGANLIVVSDHGFKSGADRPLADDGSAIEKFHRDQGICILHGPDFQAGVRLHGARLVDIAPTVLATFDLPVGRDMPGRVLAEAFKSQRAIRFIDTWETLETGAGQPIECSGECLEERELLHHFAALGYLDPTSLVGGEAAQRVALQNQWHLAQDDLDGGNLEDGLALLVELYELNPHSRDVCLALAEALYHAGLKTEAGSILNRMTTVLRERVDVMFLRGCLDLWQGRPAEALRHFRGVESSGVTWPSLLIHTAQAQMALGNGRQAIQSLEAAARLDPNSWEAWRELAGLHLELRDALKASQCALRAVEIRPDVPVAHFYLGQAWEKMGADEMAEKAYRAALHYMPGFVLAHERLTEFLSERQRPDEAENHRRAIAQIRGQRQTHERKREALRDKLAGIGLQIERCLPRTARVPDERSRPLVIVSGLPRSGTSLMMAMLEKGGLPPMTDGLRAADEHNPRGYYEWEAVKRLAVCPDILDQAQAHCVKVVSTLIPSLPGHWRYKVIYLDRPLSEVVESQLKMVRARPGRRGMLDPVKLRKSLEAERTMALAALEAADNVEWIQISFPELIQAPPAVAGRLATFLGPELLPRPGEMTAVVDSSLYRCRS